MERTSRGSLTIGISTDSLYAFEVKVQLDPGTETKDDADQRSLHYELRGDIFADDTLYWLSELMGYNEAIEEEDSHSSGTLMIVSEAIALPWLVQERANDSEGRYDQEELSTLLERKYGHGSSWMCGDHFPVTLNAECVKHIHEFISTWRPEPVFELKPGDIWLIVEPPYGDELHIVARKNVVAEE